jgi:uncharacterized membrane protein required for colicin V production
MLEMFHIGIIDIAILVIVTLFAIGGFRQGFFKEVLGILALGGAVVLTYFLADLAKEVLIEQGGLDVIIYTPLRDIFSGNAIYDQVIDGSLPNALELLTDGLTQIGLPEIFASPLASILINFEGSLGDALATSSTNLVLTVISYLATFLISWILLLIVGKQFVKLTKQNPIFKFLDSILGIVLGVGRAALMIGIAFAIAIALSLVIPDINAFFSEDLSLDTDKFSIGKFIYESIVGLIGQLL